MLAKYHEKSLDSGLAISIIVPVYNMGKYVRECLDSVLSQTMRNIEVLCVDDGSTDDSLAILLEYAEHDARVKVITQENKGVAVARNRALQAARGEYIAFMDPDDWYPSADVLERLFNTAKMHHVEIVGGSSLIQKNGVIIDSFDGFDGGCTFHAEGLVDYRDYQFEYGYWRFLYRRLFLMEHRIEFPLYKRFQDPPFFVSAMLAAKQFYAIPKPVYVYRQGHKTISWTEEKVLDILSGKRDMFVISKSAKLDVLHWNTYKRLPYVVSIVRRLQYISFEIIDKLFELDRAIDVSLIKEKIPNVEEESILQSLIADCVGAWWGALAPEDKAVGFDKMILHWGSSEVIEKLAEKYFDRKAELVKGICESNSFAYDGRKIKTVLAYIESATNGGAERVACVLCNIWADMGYRVILLTHEEPTDKDYPLSDKVERIVLKNHDNSDYANGKNYKRRAEEWAEILREYEVDAVVYHPYWNTAAFFWDALSIKANGVAAIGFWHSVFFRPLYNKNERPLEVFESYSLVDALVVLSETNRAFWKYYNGNIHVTINPLPEDWQDCNCQRVANRHDILWLGRLDPVKNPMDLIPIMKEVLLEVPDAVLHVVGKSLDGIMEKLLSDEIEKENLEGHVVLEGYSADVKSWYLSSQIFLMTSDLEGYPNALTESKMAGLPCVMYELPYLTLCEGNRGIIPVPQRDTKAAAKDIIHLLKDDERCKRYGREARAHIEELAQFDFSKKWREIFESVETGYQDAITPTEKRMMDTLLGEYTRESDRARQSEKDLWDIQHGYSFRIGRIVTWFPRKIRGGIHCFRQHGVDYTVKRILEHLGIDMGTGDFQKRK